MTLAALANLICSKVRKTDADSVTACKGFLRQRHEMIYDAALWKDTVGIWSDYLDYNETLQQWQELFHCDYDIARVLGVRWRTNRDLSPASLGTWMQADPEFYEANGEPVGFVELEARGVSFNIPTPAGVTITSSSAVDVGVEVEVSGVDDEGLEAVETVVITAGDASTATLWTSIRSITKPVTTGMVTIEGTGAAPGRMRMPPHDTVSRCCVLRFNRIPVADTADPFSDQPQVLIHAKRKLTSFVRDNDGPMIRGSDNALLAFGLADMLERERQYGKAQAKVAEGQSLLQLMIDGERNQGASLMRITPMVEEHAGGVADFGW
jgi:hypothetical protein